MATAAPIDGLRRMRRIATGLLVAVTVLYLVTRVVGDGSGALGYVEAFAEAAMVGAIADWFAVTALFRHPLGIPIPHTAIVARRKDQIGRGLGEFVQGEFMSPEIVGDRVRSAGVAGRLGSWLADPTHVAAAGRAASDVVRAAVEIVEDDAVADALAHVVDTRIRATPAAPLAGRVLRLTVDGGHHREIVDASVRAVRRFLAEQRTMLRAELERRSPWWVPEPVDDRVFAKIVAGVQSFLDEIEADPAHEVRRTVEARLRELAARLQVDPALGLEGERWKQELLDHPDVRAWIGSLWSEIERALHAAVDDPASGLRRRIDAAFERLGERLRDDAALRARVDGWVERAAVHVAENWRGEVGELIASTVERWDADETSRKLEAQVGRDLQFVRINGTLVGGLAGVVIHAIGLAVG